MIKKKVTTQKITTRLLLSLSPLWVLLTKKDTSRTFFFFFQKKKKKKNFGEKTHSRRKREFPPRNKYNI